MIKLGDRARDKLTGFEGIVVCRAEHLNGCVVFKIQPTKLTKDGKPMEPDWVDEPQAELVNSQEAKKATTPKHGPQDRPPAMHP